MELDVAGQARAPFVALSRFRVANGMTPEVQSAFRQRPHLVDRASGFLRMEVMSPHDDPSEFWLLTWWTDEDSYKTWHKSHLYRESHEGIPRGLKLDPTATQVRFFSTISD